VQQQDVAVRRIAESVDGTGYGSGAWGWQTAYRETIAS
jgi:hypothetical protein